MGANLGRAAGAGLPGFASARVAALVGRHQLHDLGGRDACPARDAAALLEEAHRRLARVAARRGSGRVGRSSRRRGDASRRRGHAGRRPLARREINGQAAGVGTGGRSRGGGQAGARSPASPASVGRGGVADRPRRHRLRPGGEPPSGCCRPRVRSSPASPASSRPLNWWWVPPAFAAEIPLLRLLRDDAARAPAGGPPAAAVVDPLQAHLRLAGADEFVADREHGGNGLRVPLVPPLRSRQHLGRVGAGGDVGRRGREPVARRGCRARAGDRCGCVPRPGSRPDRRVRNRTRHRVPFRLRAPLANGADRRAPRLGCGDRAAAGRHPRTDCPDHGVDDRGAVVRGPRSGASSPGGRATGCWIVPASP